MVQLLGDGTPTNQIFSLSSGLVQDVFEMTDNWEGWVDLPGSDLPWPLSYVMPCETRGVRLFSWGIGRETEWYSNSKLMQIFLFVLWPIHYQSRSVGHMCQDAAWWSSSSRRGNSLASDMSDSEKLNLCPYLGCFNVSFQCLSICEVKKGSFSRPVCLDHFQLWRSHVRIQIL